MKSIAIVADVTYHNVEQLPLATILDGFRRSCGWLMNSVNGHRLSLEATMRMTEALGSCLQRLFFTWFRSLNNVFLIQTQSLFCWCVTTKLKSI